VKPGKSKGKIRLSAGKFDQKTDFRAIFMKKREFFESITVLLVGWLL